MGRYFGREPRYSRQELERQAQEAIDARVAMGRPPAEDFAPLEARLAEIDRAVAVRAPVEPIADPQPLQLHEVRTPPAAQADPAVAGGRSKPVRAKAARQPVAARSSSN